MRRLLLSFAALAGSLVAAVLLAEATLRLFPGLMSEEAQLRIHWAGLGDRARTTVPHPEIGYLPIPGSTQTVERTDLSFTAVHDSRGFRNREPWPERADVVVVGDSLAFGYGVDDGEGWTDLLMERAPGLSVVNLGLVGGAPQQYLRVYEAFGRGLAPKVLLFCLFLGNDVWDAREFAKWTDAGSPGAYVTWRRGGGGGLRAAIGRLVYSSRLATLLREARRGYRYEGLTVELEGGGRMQFAPGILAQVALDGPRHPDFARVVEAVEEAARRARQDGTRFVVVFFPTKEEVYLPVLEIETPNAIAPFRRFLEERGYETLDLTAALQGGARRGEKLYFEVDGHPNGAGYEVVGETVLAHLRDHAEEYGLDL